VRVLKIVAEGITTSFRYPHFMQQIHPSYQVPPPATVYGHICSALGEWVDPTGVEFAYHFTHQGETTDIEHIVLLKRAVGKLPGSKIPKVLEGNINPFERYLLFQPRLVLYLNRPEWEPAFRSPRYAVVLGRSQDLFTYTSVSVVELQRANRAYFEHTLAPYEMALQAMQGIVTLMPRYLDYASGRSPTFARYTILRERVWLESESGFWVDPTSPEVKGAHLGLVFLSFTGGDSETIGMA
jgi:CRISPR-associated protein Cas5t